MTVAPLGEAQLLEGHWQPSCALLVMPGGADLPYCRHLDGAGNRLIRAYVESGGAYLGLCAGAYYACARVEFEPGTGLEVVGDRELAFFPGTARGSVFPGFDYRSERGAVAAGLSFHPAVAAGLSFHPTVAAGLSFHPAASARAGGRRQGWARCVDYVNGGPAFELATGGALGETAEVESVSLLASYADAGGAAAAVLCRVGCGRAVLCGSHPELHPSWLELAGGAARSDVAPWELGAALSAARAAAEGRPALVTGRELPAEEGEGQGGADDARRLAKLRVDLEAGADARWYFWCSLLAAAGLRDALREHSAAAAEAASLG